MAGSWLLTSFVGHVLRVICTRLRPGHMSVCVGDSLQCSEEIVKISRGAPFCAIIIIIIIIIIVIIDIVIIIVVIIIMIIILIMMFGRDLILEASATLEHELMCELFCFLGSFTSQQQMKCISGRDHPC